LFVPLLAGLYSKRPTASAAVISMAVSVPLTFAVDLLTKGAGFGFATPALVGIGTSGGIFVLFSMRRSGGTSV
jgi:SSS family solute:Na+ symporter